MVECRHVRGGSRPSVDSVVADRQLGKLTGDRSLDHFCRRVPSLLLLLRNFIGEETRP
jgi:hypothetical protein